MTNEPVRLDGHGEDEQRVVAIRPPARGEEARMDKGEKADLARIEQKLDALTKLVLEVKAEKRKDAPELRVLHNLTTKQHVALQMILAGCSNMDIARAMGVTENSAKVHVRTVAAKIGVSSRAQIVARMLPVMGQVDPSEYEYMSGGLPLDWINREPDERDEYDHLYRKRD